MDEGGLAYNSRDPLPDSLGNVQVARGKGDDALEAYRAGLAIAQRLAELDPGNTAWQRDLIVGNVKLAECGDSPGLRYRSALAIAESLAGSGRMQPIDRWMAEDLQRRLDSIG